MLDMWTDVFASPGWRTTGTKASTFVVAPPGWRPDLRERLAEEFRLPSNAQRIDAPTPYVWIIGRIQTNGPEDYDAVHEVQSGLRITPLSQWGRPAEPVAQTIDPGLDMKTPPKAQVERMPAAEFFATAAEILKRQPPHITDQPILALLKRIGLEPGKSFDLGSNPTIKTALERVPEDAQKLMAWKLPTLARVTNGWLMNTTTTSLLLGTPFAKAQDASGRLTEDEARSIGVNAYIYLYPLVTMDITPQAAHQCAAGPRDRRAAEHLRQCRRIPESRGQGCGAAELRHGNDYS